jgi:transglutaminase-like putative cysteine protease
MTAPWRYQVRHQTAYAYGGTVAHAHHLLHLTPRNTRTQTCLEHSLEIWPLATECTRGIDAFGNHVVRMELEQPHGSLKVTARMKMELAVQPAVNASDSLPWEQVRDSLRYLAAPVDPESLEALRYRTQSHFVPIKRVFEQYAQSSFAPGLPLLAGAEALMQKIHSDFAYAQGETEIGTTLLELLTTRRGVCQDFAHFMIACLRSLGLAARYVSGYLCTRPRADGPELVGADASHAWVSVYAPPLGWIGLDPTNNLRVDLEHVVLAWGRDFGDVSPMRGVILGGGSQSLEVGVAVHQLG